MLIQIDDVIKGLEFEADYVERMARELAQTAPDVTPKEWSDGYIKGLRRAKEFIEAQINLEAIKEAEELSWQNTK